MPNLKNKKVIKDQQGQRKYPGRVTEIQGNTMATTGYGDIPLYVVPNVGNPMVVPANIGNIVFPGASSFTEYPIAKNGGWLEKYQDGGYKSQEEYESHLLDPYTKEKRQSQLKWINSQLEATKALNDIKNRRKVKDYDIPENTPANVRQYAEISPTGYTDLGNYIRYATGNSRPDMDKPKTTLADEEAWMKYNNIPHENKSIIPSTYKPSTSKNINTIYHKFDNVTDSLMFNDIENKLKDKPYGNIQVGEMEMYNGPTTETGYNMYSPLGNFTIGKGKDEKGDYLSYYDKYDFDSAPKFVQNRLPGNEFEFYNRRYLKPKLSVWDKALLKNKKIVPKKEMGGWLDTYEDGGETNPPIGLKNNQWMGANLNKEGYITSETKGGNRISFTSDQKADDFFNKQIDSGKWGFDPKTGGTFLLKKPVKGLSKEDQFIATKEYHDLRAPKGFTNESQKEQIAKLPKFQQDIINAENEKRRKKVVSDSMQEVGKHPLFYAPGIIGAAPFAVAGLSEAGMASAPYIQGALSTQLPGMANVSGATVGNAITAGFAGHGAAHITPDAIEMYKNPSWSNAGSLLMDVAEVSPIIGPTSKVIGKGLNTAGKYLTEETALKNAYKLNPYAFKPNPEAYYRGIGRSGLDDALESGVLKTANKTGNYGEDLYITKDFNTAKGNYSKDQPYGKGDIWGDDWEMIKPKDSKSYIAEIPESSLINKTNVTGSIDDLNIIKNKGSIPTNDVKLLKQHWLKGYKEVPKSNKIKQVIHEDVKLVSNAKRSQELDGEAFSIYKGNKNVGEISGKRLSNGDFEVSDVNVDSQFQKQGIGTQVYKQLNQSLEPGNKVKSWGAFVENNGVAPGKSTWQSLEKQGLAKLNEKGTYEMLPKELPGSSNALQNKQDNSQWLDKYK